MLLAHLLSSTMATWQCTRKTLEEDLSALHHEQKLDGLGFLVALGTCSSFAVGGQCESTSVALNIRPLCVWYRSEGLGDSAADNVAVLCSKQAEAVGAMN